MFWLISFSVFEECICDQTLLKKRRKIKSKRSSASDEEIDRILREILAKNEELKDSGDIDRIILSLRDDSKISDLPKYLLIGVNVITRFLEKHGTLSLLVVSFVLIQLFL